MTTRTSTCRDLGSQLFGRMKWMPGGINGCKVSNLDIFTIEIGLRQLDPVSFGVHLHSVGLEYFLPAGIMGHGFFFRKLAKIPKSKKKGG